MANIWRRPVGNPVGPGNIIIGEYALDPNNPWGRWNPWAIEGGIWAARELDEPPISIASLNVLGGNLTLCVGDGYTNTEVADALTALNAGFNANRDAMTIEAVAEEVTHCVISVNMGSVTIANAVKAMTAAFGIVYDILADNLAEAYVPLSWAPSIDTDTCFITVVLEDTAAANYWATVASEWAALWLET